MTELLVLDDDRQASEPLKKVFEQAGYTVFLAQEADEAKKIISERNIALAILDVTLSFDQEWAGFSVAIWIRENYPKTCIVIYTSEKIETKSRIRGFEIGADDYIQKSTMDSMEIKLRIEAILRRSGIIPSVRLLYSDFVLMPDRNIIERVGRGQMRLTNSESKLLKVLFENPRKTMNRSLLIQAVTEKGDPKKRYLDTLISTLRSKARETLGVEIPISGVRDFGYELN